MRNHQEALVPRYANGNETIFHFRMIRVVNGNAEGVSKRRGGFIERDAMLLQI
jgi:hypothetical protein